MNPRSPAAIFLAATAILVSSNVPTELVQASEQKGMGGLKEWTTDQEINEESMLDKDAKKAAKKAKKQNICIPVGEGENCW